eukprot:GHVS01061639.1.p1 GENE.GHVS01061639.1~~GHVS01061639.1.p1  ORF type:complete len:536 (-),score=51.88 GHVS01061639.1:10-1617(-)
MILVEKFSVCINTNLAYFGAPLWILDSCQRAGDTSRLKMKFHLIFQLCLILPFLLLPAKAEDPKPLGAGRIFEELDDKTCQKMSFKTEVRIDRTHLTGQGCPIGKVPVEENGLSGCMLSRNNQLVLAGGHFTVHLSAPLTEDETKFIFGSILGVKFLVKGAGDDVALHHLLKGLVDADVCFERNSDAEVVMLQNYASWKDELNTKMGNAFVKDEKNFVKSRWWLPTWIPGNHPVQPSQWDINWHTMFETNEKWKEYTKWSTIRKTNEYHIVFKYVYQSVYPSKEICVQVAAQMDGSVYQLNVFVVGDKSPFSDADATMQKNCKDKLTVPLVKSILKHVQILKKGGPLEIVMMPKDDESVLFAVALMMAAPETHFLITPDTAMEMHKRAEEPLMKQFLAKGKKRTTYDQTKSFETNDVYAARTQKELDRITANSLINDAAKAAGLSSKVVEGDLSASTDQLQQPGETTGLDGEVPDESDAAKAAGLSSKVVEGDLSASTTAVYALLREDPDSILARTTSTPLVSVHSACREGTVVM